MIRLCTKEKNRKCFYQDIVLVKFLMGISMSHAAESKQATNPCMKRVNGNMSFIFTILSFINMKISNKRKIHFFLKSLPIFI